MIIYILDDFQGFHRNTTDMKSFIYECGANWPSTPARQKERHRSASSVKIQNVLNSQEESQRVRHAALLITIK